MRFALKVVDSEPLFLSAYYENSGEALWTTKATDACSYSSINKAKAVLNKASKTLEIVSVSF